MNRINLKFALENEKQRQAFEILQKHKRDKTQFVSECVLFYINNQNISEDISEIKKLLQGVSIQSGQPAVASDNSERKNEITNEIQKQDKKEEVTTDKSRKYSDEDYTDMLDSLSLFDQ